MPLKSSLGSLAPSPLCYGHLLPWVRAEKVPSPLPHVLIYMRKEHWNISFNMLWLGPGWTLGAPQEYSAMQALLHHL